MGEILIIGHQAGGIATVSSISILDVTNPLIPVVLNITATSISKCYGIIPLGNLTFMAHFHTFGTGTFYFKVFKIVENPIDTFTF